LWTRCFRNNDDNSVTSPSLSVALCDILLQESLPHGEIDCTISELVMCACNELGCGVTSTSQRDAFCFIFCLYQVPAGRKELNKLGQSGGLLEHVAKETFKEWELSLPDLLRLISIVQRHGLCRASISCLVLCRFCRGSSWIPPPCSWAKWIVFDHFKTSGVHPCQRTVPHFSNWFEDDPVAMHTST